MRAAVKKLVYATLIGLSAAWVASCDEIRERVRGEKVAMADVPQAVWRTATRSSLPGGASPAVQDFFAQAMQ